LHRLFETQEGNNNHVTLSIDFSQKPSDMNFTDIISPFFDNSVSELSSFSIPRMQKAVKNLQIYRQWQTIGTKA
jgi:hypothetical protein